MTEKRFEINNLVKKGDMSFWDNENKSILNASHTLDLLNNLSEDYDYLEKRFKEEEWHYEHIDEDRDVWMHKCHVLEKENEQLKKIIQKYYDTTNSNGKQLISDLIDCFEMEGLNVSWINKE